MGLAVARTIFRFCHGNPRVLATFLFALRFLPFMVWPLKPLREKAKGSETLRKDQRPLIFPVLTLTPYLPYRTESVAEKMLTNWFTFLLYKFLKVRMEHLVNHVEWGWGKDLSAWFVRTIACALGIGNTKVWGGWFHIWYTPIFCKTKLTIVTSLPILCYHHVNF